MKKNAVLEVILVQGFYPLKINQFPNGVHLKLQYKLSLRLATTPMFKIAAGYQWQPTLLPHLPVTFHRRNTKCDALIGPLKSKLL